MSKMENYRILDEIDKSKGYNIALFTTFNFEVSYFERRILPLLLKNKIKTIDLFVDSKQLVESIKNTNSAMLGKRYHLNAVNMNASFHPKVIFLLGDKKGKIIVSSANIKTSGYEFNNEVFCSYEYTDDSFYHSSIIKDTVDFFISLYETVNDKDITIYNYLANLDIKGDETTNNKMIVHNLDTDILTQIQKRIQSKVYEIDVAVPFYDDKLIAFQSIKEKFTCNNVNLFIQNYKNSFPVEFNRKNNVVDQNRINIFDVVKNNENSNFYHGKFFRFISDEREYALFGSSNCTQSALLKSFKEGGNIEFCVLEENDCGYYNYYFENYQVTDGKEIYSDLCNYQSQETIDQNHIFLYGYRENNSVILFFKHKIFIKNLIVKYNNTNVKHKYEYSLLIITLNIDDLEGLSTIIDLKLIYDGTEENVKCWFIDSSYLYQFRVYSEEYKLIDYKLNDGLEKYMKYVDSINKAIIDNIEQLDFVSQADVSDDYGEKGLEEEKGNDEGFILYDTVEDKFPIENSLKYIAGKANALSKRYFSSVLRNEKSDSHINTAYERHNVSNQSREATTQERRFGRHLKRIIKEYVVGEKTKHVSYKNYKNIIGSVLDPIEQLYYVEKAKDFLDYGFILESKIKISEILLNKMMGSETDINKVEDESFILKTIIEVLKEYSNNNQLMDIIDRLVFKLDMNYHLKNNLHELLIGIDLFDVDEKDLAIYYFSKIDELIGYKDQEQMKQYLLQVYGSEPRISIVDKKMIITLEVDKHHGSIAQKHIVEIAKFINGNGLRSNKILIIFNYEQNRQISYEIRIAKTHINTVVQNSDFGSIECKLVNGIYKIDYSRIRDILARPRL